MKSDLINWSNELGFKLFLNSGESNARGTLIGISKNFQFDDIKYYDDKDGRLQILTGNHNDKKIMAINVYNSNYQDEQVTLLNKLREQMENYENILDYHIVMGGDWNFIFNKDLDHHGGNSDPPLKMSSIAEITKIINKFELCDIYRIRNPDKKRFTWRKANPKTQRRLDYFLISNEMQEQVAKIDVLNSVCSDHSPVIVTFKPVSETSKNTAYWKFNGSLLKDKDFCKNLAIEIENLKISLANFQPQEKWELLKFKIRAFCIKFSKEKAKERKDKINKLEEIIRDYETLPDGNPNLYLESKLKYEEMLNVKTAGSILRSRATIYENNEKSSKYFLSLEKKMLLKILLEF